VVSRRLGAHELTELIRRTQAEIGQSITLRCHALLDPILKVDVELMNRASGTSQPTWHFLECNSVVDGVLTLWSNGSKRPSGDTVDAILLSRVGGIPQAACACSPPLP
jgi:hypothetical protein